MAALVLVAVLVLLLALPVDIAFDAACHDTDPPRPVQAELTVGWLAGRHRFRWPRPAADRRRARRRAPPPEAASTSPRDKPARRRVQRRALALFADPALRQRALQLLADLLRQAHPQQLRLWLRVGLDDPADTGLLWALLGPLAAAGRRWRGIDLRLEPAFPDAAFAFRASGRLRLVPLRLIGLLLTFAVSPPVWRAGFRALRRGR